jgi:hypothetical protein
MDQKISGGRILEIALFSLSSMLLYYTGVGIFLFLVPLQVVASRRGIRGLLAAVGAFLVVFLAIRFWPFISSGGGTAPDILTYMEIGIVAALLLGLVAINAPMRHRQRTMIMILAATAVTGLAAVPAGILLTANAGFQASMNGLFTEISSTLSGLFTTTADGVASSLMSSLLEPARLRQISEAYLLRSLLVDYAMLISFSWWAGQAAASRAPVVFGDVPRFRFAQFRLESWWLWPLIGSAALVLADLFFGLSAWAYAVWNLALVLLFQYGLQGMAILWFLFDKHRIPRFLWVLLIIGLAILAASPGAGVFIVLAIPVLGISENWVRYRIPRDAAPPEED